jgi:hypothetical protein
MLFPHDGMNCEKAVKDLRDASREKVHDQVHNNEDFEEYFVSFKRVYLTSLKPIIHLLNVIRLI